MRNRLHFKVGDLGVSNLQSKFASTVQVEQNQLCMAPEMWSKTGKKGCWDADVFSLGVMAYRMMALKYPFPTIPDVINPSLLADK